MRWILEDGAFRTARSLGQPNVALPEMGEWTTHYRMQPSTQSCWPRSLAIAGADDKLLPKLR
jgi:hypothetical protein